MRAHVLLLLVSAFVPEVSGHATLVSPNPRGQDGNLWYQVGCIIGCTCSGASSKELYVTPASFGCTTPMEPTNNDASTRTWNVKQLSPNGDYAKYNPWRAPGHSIPLNGCGVASGFMTGGFERVAAGGQKSFYQSAVPNGYKAGDPGTNVPVVNTTEWAAGGTAEVMFAIDVNHGGGYQYRLCPKSKDVTEECFQLNPLAFASQDHTIRYSDGSRADFQIPATDVTKGVKPAGAAWRRNPIPTCNCDLGTGCTAATGDGKKLYNGVGAYAAYATEVADGECATGLQFPKLWDEGFGYYGPNRAAEKGGDGKGTDGKAASIQTVDQACMKLANEETCKTDAKCKWTLFTGKGHYCWGADSDTKKAADSTATKKDTGATKKDTGATEKDTGGRLRRMIQEPHDDDHHHHDGHRMLAMADGTYRCPVCGYIYNPKNHDGKSFDSLAATWRCPVCATPKNMFKDSTQYVDEVGVAPASGYRWHIVDKVVVPTTPGEYVLSWRWDCEQTPQIWTNCADIKVTATSTTANPTESKEATTTVVKKAVATVVYTIPHVDFAKLESVPGLKGQLTTAVKTAVLAELDSRYTLDHIDVVLSAGSVVASVSIKPLEGVTAAELVTSLVTKEKALTAGVNSEVVKVDNLEKALSSDKKLTDVKVTSSTPVLSGSSDGSAVNLATRGSLHCLIVLLAVLLMPIAACRVFP